ncbi:MAG: ABC transporter permease [Clostridia bacterium]|jgi:general nucleoside transport system permease protein|nr:ABC transporter permease [Clostridia bacterium]
MGWVEVTTGFLSATIAMGTVLLLACIGEILTEKSGVLNLGLEGMMIVGAVFAFIVVQTTGNLVLAIAASLLAGALMGLIHAFITVTLKASQVVSGLALTIFGVGLANFLGQNYVGTVRVASLQAIPIPLLSEIPIIGEALFNQSILVYVSILLVPISWILIYRTRAGLKLRAVGENPSSADSLGINVFATRYIYTLIGGALTGLAGAYLSIGFNSSWMDSITGGQGWIAVALVIFATWNPIKAMLGSYLFGFILILGLRLQAFGIEIPEMLFTMLPYIFTIVVLIFSTGKFGKNSKIKQREPGSLGTPYDREARH